MDEQIIIEISVRDYRALVEANARLSMIADYIKGSDYINAETIQILAGIAKKEDEGDA